MSLRRLSRMLERALSRRRARRRKRIAAAERRCLATRMFREWQRKPGRRNGHFSHAQVVRMLAQFSREKAGAASKEVGRG